MIFIAAAAIFTIWDAEWLLGGNGFRWAMIVNLPLYLYGLFLGLRAPSTGDERK